MNIICNSCVGGHLYKRCLNKPFSTPFIWNLIDFDSMLYMVKNFHTINWLDYELVKDDKWNFSIIVEGNAKIQYIHYKFDPKATTLYRKGVDVYYCSIWEYIVNRYEDRVARMVSNVDQPIFIFANWWDVPVTLLSYENLYRLDDLKMYNIIVGVNKIHPELHYVKQIIRKMPDDKCNAGLAERIYEKFLK